MVGETERDTSLVREEKSSDGRDEKELSISSMKRMKNNNGRTREERERRFVRGLNMEGGSDKEGFPPIPEKDKR